MVSLAHVATALEDRILPPALYDHDGFLLGWLLKSVRMCVSVWVVLRRCGSWGVLGNYSGLSRCCCVVAAAASPRLRPWGSVVFFGYVPRDDGDHADAFS